MPHKRIDAAILDEISYMARLLARIPSLKELAARGRCSERQLQYHLRKQLIREKRIRRLALKEREV